MTGYVKNEYWLERALENIRGTYGVQTSVDLKNKSLIKFGRNIDLGTTEEQVWLVGGTESLPTTNAITHFSSSDASDTQDIVVEGHTIDENDDLIFSTQTVTLDGQTKTALTTPLARATRLYNDNATDFAGVVYVYQDDTVTAGVPQTLSKIHMQTEGTNNQSLKAATSVSSTDYWIITGIAVGVERQQLRSVDFKLQVRLKGKTFRTQATFSAHSNGGTRNIEFKPYIIAPANSDVRVMATSSGVTTQVDARISGVLAIEQ